MRYRPRYRQRRRYFNKRGYSRQSRRKDDVGRAALKVARAGWGAGKFAYRTAKKGYGVAKFGYRILRGGVRVVESALRRR